MNSQPVFEQKHNIPNNYYSFDEGLTQEEVDLIIKSFSDDNLLEAVVGTEKEIDEEIRRSKVTFIPKDEEWEWLYDRLMNLARIANEEMWHFNLVSAPEMIQYTTYNAEDNGHYGAHMDCGSGNASLRKVSVTVQLTESSEYEGGDLQILRANEKWINTPRGLGATVIFPSFLYHKVTPVTSGTRRSLVLWVGGEHYK